MKLNKYINKAKDAVLSVCKVVAELFGKTAVLKIGRKPRTVYPVRIFALSLAALLILCSLISALSGLGAAGVFDLSIYGGSDFKTKTKEDNVLIYNNRGVWELTPSGKEEWHISQTLSEPFVELGGEYVLLADLAGNHFAASYKDGKLQNDFKIESDIISAKVTDKGYTAFATDTDGYKGKVIVFNKRGKEIYQWNSGNGYITDIDITDNGKLLAVARLITSGEKAGTEIQFIDIRRGEKKSAVTLSDEIAVNISFNGGRGLTVVTEKHILGYNTQGKEKFSVSLVGKSPSLYNIDSEDTIAVVTQGERGNSVLELYSGSGRLRGSYIATGDIRALCVSKREAIVAEQRGIVRINARGKEKCVKGISHDIKSIGYFEDAKKAITIGSANADIINIK